MKSFKQKREFSKKMLFFLKSFSKKKKKKIKKEKKSEIDMLKDKCFQKTFFLHTKKVFSKEDVS